MGEQMRITHRRLAALAIAATLATGGPATSGAAAASAAPATTTQSAPAGDHDDHKGKHEDRDHCPEWLRWDFYGHEHHQDWFAEGSWWW
jgi:hypothetical protein